MRICRSLCLIFSKFSVEEATFEDCSNVYGTCHRRQSFIHMCEAEKTFIKKGNGRNTLRRITGSFHCWPLRKDGNIFRGLYEETIGRFDTLIHNVPLSNKYILNTLNVPDFIAKNTQGKVKSAPVMSSLYHRDDIQILVLTNRLCYLIPTGSFIWYQPVQLNRWKITGWKITARLTSSEPANQPKWPVQKLLLGQNNRLNYPVQNNLHQSENKHIVKSLGFNNQRK